MRKILLGVCVVFGAIGACKREPPAVFNSEEAPKKKARAADSVAAAASASASASAAPKPEVDLRTVLTMKAKSIKTEVAGYEQYVVVAFDMTNTTEKVISGFKGKLVFRDAFGDIVLTLPFKMQEEVPARSTKLVRPTWDYNKFDRPIQTLASFDVAKGTVEWVPEVLLFGDGTRLPVQVTPLPSASAAPSASASAPPAPSSVLPW